MRRKICAIALAVLTLSLPVHSFASGGAAEKAASAERTAFAEEAEEIVWEEDDARESESVADSPWESAALMDDAPTASTPAPSPSLTAAPAPTADPTSSPVPTPALTVTPVVTPGVTYSVTVTGGSGSGRYHPGEIITVAMDPAPEGMRLKSVNHTKDVPFTRVTGAERVTYTFVMPSTDVSVRAVYEEDVYTVTVTGGSGSGKYHPGDIVNVSAYPLAGKRLWGWQRTTGFTISYDGDTSLVGGSFAMPTKNVWLAAIYTDTKTGGQQWMRLDGDKVIVSAKGADKQNLEGSVLLAACTESGQMLSAAQEILPDTQTASVDLKLTGADSVTAFFLDSTWRPIVGKITVPIPVAESTT